jgi:hypothetical protein
MELLDPMDYIDPEELIKIVGTDEKKRFTDVVNKIVYVSGRWYWRNDDRIVRAYDSRDDTFRYHRVKDTVNINNGDLILRKNAVELSLDRGLCDVSHCTFLDGEWHYRREVVNIGGRSYPITGGEVVYTKRGWRLHKDCIRLSEEWYSPLSYRASLSLAQNTYDALYKLEMYDVLDKCSLSWIEKDAIVIDSLKEYKKYYSNRRLRSDPVVVETRDGLLEFDDTDLYLSPEGDVEIKHIRWMDEPALYVVVQVDFDIDIINNRSEALLRAKAPAEYSDGYDFEYLSELDEYVVEDLARKLLDHWRDSVYKFNVESTEQERARANTRFGDVGPDENNAKVVDCTYERPRGGHIISDFRASKQNSITFKAFGGMRYHFGVEIETCTGLLNNEMLKKARLALISDGTISAGEYATGVLHGDLGYRNLQTIMKYISENTFVDDSGAIHVHLSGAKFNRMFSVYSIMLGVQLEKEMFQIQPRSKHPVKKHCSGIAQCYGADPNYDDEIWSKSYAKIDEKNWRHYLGDYVFNHPFSNSINSNVELGKWTEGRYKWLNLVNCNSLGRFETIEFRSFASTTSFDKVYNNVLLSMAFVWFVENRRTRIKQGGVTLSEIVTSAYKRRYDLRSRLLNFIYERKLKFNRTDI